MKPWNGICALVLVAGLLGGCVRPSPSSDCAGGPVAEVVPGAAPAGPSSPGAAGQSSPGAAVGQSSPGSVPVGQNAGGGLWVADGGGAVQAVDGRTGRVVKTVTVAGIEPRMPPALVAAGGSLWVYRFDTGALARIDPVTGAVRARATVKPVTRLVENGITFAHGSLWIAQPGKLWRVSPAGQVSSTALPIGFGPSAAAATGRWLWLASGKQLLRIDPARPENTTEIELTESVGQLTYIDDVNATGGRLYAVGINSPVVRRLDPDSGAVVGQTRLKHDELALSLAGNWAIGNCGSVVRLPDGPAVRVSDISQDLPSVLVGGDLWVGDEVRSEIVRIDAATGQVRARLPFAATDPDDPAFNLMAGAGTGSVWVLDGGVSRVDADRVTRILPAEPGESRAAAAF
ncbi:hypothetical protein [Actinoplanes sp. NPDC026619]|uniref:hypothetical protein n=1 Tax=Actinoplanes sp. NPDC026619 TaxID=3155798 RepID=UPI0033DF027B